MADSFLLIRQLATSLKAGLTPEHALTLQVRHARGPLHAKLQAAAAQVRRGRPMAEALRAFELPAEDLALIRLAEESGRLPELLQDLATELEADRDLRRELWGGLAYPGALLFASPLIGALPALVTQDGGAFVRAALPGIGFAGALLGGVVGLARHPVGVRFGLALPLLGGLIRQQRLRRFTVSLALAYRSGIPLATALVTLGQAHTEPRLKSAARMAAAMADQGQPLSVALARFPDLFPPMFMQLLRTGEASGSLDTSLLKFSEYLEGELELKRKLVGRFGGMLALLIALGLMASRILASVGSLYQHLPK